MTYTTDLPDLHTCITIFIILIFAYVAKWVTELIIGE